MRVLSSGMARLMRRPFSSRVRYGKRYYSFNYRGALFLCLCSENPPDEMGAIDKAQQEWVAKTVEANKDAKWTFVFLHKPIWTAKDLDQNGWAAVEKALAGAQVGRRRLGGGRFHEALLVRQLHHFIAQGAGLPQQLFDIRPLQAVRLCGEEGLDEVEALGDRALSEAGQADDHGDAAGEGPEEGRLGRLGGGGDDEDPGTALHLGITETAEASPVQEGEEHLLALRGKAVDLVQDEDAGAGKDGSGEGDELRDGDAADV